MTPSASKNAYDLFQASFIPFLAAFISVSLTQDYLPPSVGSERGGSRGGRYGPPSNDGPSVSFFPNKLLCPNRALIMKRTVVDENLHFKADELESDSLFVLKTPLFSSL
jgi:hypothetical protein